jgi:hypothetical protein
MKTEDLLALLNSGFICEKEMDSWRAAAVGVLDRQPTKWSTRSR